MPKERQRHINATASPILARHLQKGPDAIATMADDMRVMVTRTGNVTKDDLFQIGWTSVQVTELGQRARERAAELSSQAA